MRLSLSNKAVIVIFLVLFLDQAVKIWVKTHMLLHQTYHVLGDKFLIQFIENNGMAFGMEFGGTAGKLILSLFRIFAVAGIGVYLIYIIRQKAHSGFVISIALIFSGAIGNIIDSALYGIIFSNSTEYQVAQLFPHGGGYSSFLHGKVVDMLYFPLFHGQFPDWLPIWGSEPFLFFSPIFNCADSSITIGVFIILIFQKVFFPK